MVRTLSIFFYMCVLFLTMHEYEMADPGKKDAIFCSANPGKLCSHFSGWHRRVFSFIAQLPGRWQPGVVVVAAILNGWNKPGKHSYTCHKPYLSQFFVISTYVWNYISTTCVYTCFLYVYISSLVGNHPVVVPAWLTPPAVRPQRWIQDSVDTRPTRTRLHFPNGYIHGEP